MSGAGATGLVAICAAAALTAAAAGSGAEAPVDLRSQILLDLDCSSRLGRTRTSLFGNGTVRYREWVDENERMLLMEFGGERLQAYVNRISEINLEETESIRYGAAGEWVEQCELAVAPASGPGRRFRFNRYDSLPLALSRMVTIADELQETVESEATLARFPPGYRPAAGDVLERRDGLLFEVVAYTGDDRGIELHGVEQPLVMYVPVDDVVGQFVALVEDEDREEEEER